MAGKAGQLGSKPTEVPLRFDVRCLQIRGWFLIKSSANAPCGAYPHLQAPQACECAPGVLPVCDGGGPVEECFVDL
jgi:hypothetical protein